MAKGNKKNAKNISYPIITDFEVQEVYRILKKKYPDVEFCLDFDHSEFPLLVDILAPGGIPKLELNGKTIIAIKRRISYASFTNINSFFEPRSDEYNILVVYFESNLSEVPPNTINKTRRSLIYISIAELKDSIRSTSLKSVERENEKFYQNLQKDWKATREAIIKEAKEIVKDGNNVLVLGAGVGMSANMPSWTQLLQGIMRAVPNLEKDTLEAFCQLDTHVYEQCGNSNLIMARYLQTAVELSGRDEPFFSLIQKHLYPTDKNSERTSPLLRILAKIIQFRKVNEVITYNFDDILEQELVNFGMREGVDFSSIAKHAEVKDHNNLPIYHVHGIIPEKGLADTVVFTENEYHERYKDSYHWSNIEQLHAMSRMHCFFVGLSMNDPNLRRLLDFSTRLNKRDKADHFAFLNRSNLDKYCIPEAGKYCKYTQISGSLIDKKKQKEIYELNYGVLDQMFRDLGVKVIWFEDYKEELPRLVAQVFGIYTDSHHETSEPTDTNSILNETQEKINRIKEIEDKAAQLNKPVTDLAQFFKIYKYINDNKQEYKNLIDDVYGRINALSDRVKIEIPEDINKMLNNIPQFNGTISGFGQFYSIIFDSLYKLLEEK